MVVDESVFQSEVVALEVAVADSSVQRFWVDYLSAKAHPCAFSSSPEYLQQLSTVNPASIKVVIVYDSERNVRALAMVQRKLHPVKFDVASRELFSVKLNLTGVIGSIPLVSDDGAVQRALLQGIALAWPDSQGVYHDALPVDNDWSVFVNGVSHKGQLIYSPYGQRPWHMLELCADFDEYLSRLSRRSRQARKREVRKLERHGEVEFVLCDSDATLERFIQSAVKVSGKTWQFSRFGGGVTDDSATRAAYQQHINNGTKRSYTLYCGGEPVAFCVGFQAYGVYQTWEIGFDQDYADLSPGTVLMLKIIEELHQRDKPVYINYGVGDSTYKRRFANWSGNDETLMLLNASVGNRLLMVAHKGFLQLLELGKRAVGRKTKD